MTEIFDCYILFYLQLTQFQPFFEPELNVTDPSEGSSNSSEALSGKHNRRVLIGQLQESQISHDKRKQECNQFWIIKLFI